ncbi:hypothetical protein RJT34_23877 [Clitoria ternatea]|uniref:NAC domain-containing protein n=1 Tax=Clitoria ternatea TaxID=43366 RepID=A0AAN9FNI6_CLITE
MASDMGSRKEFKATDEEMIELLNKKVHGKPLSKNGVILEHDLYGEKNPWEIWQEFEGDSKSYGGKDLYFFTRPKKKFPNGSRLVRTIGVGSWEGEDVGKEVVATETKERIGMKKRFRFEKSGTPHDGAWIMHEYSLHSSLITDASANNYFLCRFRKNLRHGVHEEKGVEGTKNLGEDFGRRPRNQQRNRNPQSKKVEATKYKEQVGDDDDDCMSWPELFSLQLRNLIDVPIQDEEAIDLLPNTFKK